MIQTNTLDSKTDKTTETRVVSSASRYLLRDNTSFATSDRYYGNTVPLPQMEQMLVDPCVRYAYDFFVNGINGSYGRYVDNSANKNHEAFVNEQLLPVIRRDLPQLLSAVYYGAAIGELIYEPVDTGIKLKRIHVVHPRTWWNGTPFNRDDVTGEVTAITLFGCEPVPVFNDAGIRQLIHFAYRGSFDNPFGFATARQIYRPWYIKNELTKVEALGLENLAVPTVIVQSEDTSRRDEIGGSYFGSGANKVLGIGLTDKVSTLSTSWSSSGSPFSDIFRRLNGDIFNSFYQPTLISQEGEFSTRAMANTHYDVYKRSERVVAETVVEQVLMPQIIEPAIRLQFGEAAQGTVSINDNSAVNAKELSSVVAELSALGLVNKQSSEFTDWLSEQLDMPIEYVGE